MQRNFISVHGSFGARKINLWGIFGRLYLGNNKLEKESNKICFIADACQEKKRDVSWEKKTK